VPTRPDDDATDDPRVAQFAQVAVMTPVWLDGRAVDLRFTHVTEDFAEWLEGENTTFGGNPIGALVSDVYPTSRASGTLDRLLQVATSGVPFAVSSPGTADGVRPGRRYYVQRADSGDLVLVSRPLAAADLAQERAEQDGPRWRRAFAEAPFGVAVSNPAGDVFEPSEQLCRMFERTPAEMVGHRFNDFAHPDDQSIRVDRALLRATGRYEMVKRFLRPDGTVLVARVVSCTIKENGEERLLSFFEDISDRMASQREMTRLATEDALTGLPNRPEFRRLLRVELSYGGSPALLFVDLDHFKVVNDSLGHDAGDQLLRQVAQKLAWSVGDRGVVGRLGGDEFVVLVREPHLALDVAHGVVRALSGSERLGSRDVTLGASVGLAYAGRSTDDDALLRDADTALYAAKRDGRARVRVFDEALRERALSRLEDEAALRRGLVAGEIIPHYQPIFDRHGRLHSVEALVRWYHPARGLLTPASFLEMAQETGLVVDIGREVLWHGAHQVRRWRTRLPHLRLSINIDAQHIMGGGLLEDLDRTLRETGLGYDALLLEITESALVAGDRVTETMQQLRALGCHIAVDDFGTGFSSLAYLRDFPVDVLKVDRSFVAGSNHPRGATLLNGICALGRSLGMMLVSEGVETEHERDNVVAAGTDLLQGYLLGLPGPAEGLDSLVEDAAFFLL
jgi:diguanylate cyclase (GGDEF)-like protein/PAS domain S-box-containing protein